MNDSVTVVVPTYNERNGIVSAIRRIISVIPYAEIIIVDDNSPDKTALLVKSQFNRNRKIKLIVRKIKAGRGSAVTEGIRKGLMNKKAKYFIEMDADLCHDPKHIPALIAACRSVDIAIASRYVPNAVVKGWSIKRRIMSGTINRLAKTLLQVPIADYSGGFRCYSRKAAEYLCSQKLQSSGFIVLSETAYLCYKKGFRFKEIPIEMQFRPVSKSNLTLNEMKEALFTLLKLRFSP